MSLSYGKGVSSHVPPFGSDDKDKINFYLVPSVGPDLGLPGKLSFNILPSSNDRTKTSKHGPYFCPQHIFSICFKKKKRTKKCQHQGGNTKDLSGSQKNKVIPTCTYWKDKKSLSLSGIFCLIVMGNCTQHKTEQIYDPALNVPSLEHSLLCEDCVSQASDLTWVWIKLSSFLSKMF